MDFMEIMDSLESGETVLTPTDLTNLVVMACTKNEHINCNSLAEIIKGLQGVKKSASADFDAAQKEIEKENKAEVAKRARAWFATLKEGEPITWHDSKSLNVIEGTVGKQKEGNIRAHVLLNEIPANSKAQNPKPDRYVPFENLFVPADFVMEEVA